MVRIQIQCCIIIVFRKVDNATQTWFCGFLFLAALTNSNLKIQLAIFRQRLASLLAVTTTEAPYLSIIAKMVCLPSQSDVSYLLWLKEILFGVVLVMRNLDENRRPPGGCKLSALGVIKQGLWRQHQRTNQGAGNVYTHWHTLNTVVVNNK